MQRQSFYFGKENFMDLYGNGEKFLTDKNLIIGGRNYILNSGDFSSNWIITGGVVTSDSYCGGKVVSLNNNGNGANSVSQKIQMTVSQMVSWSVYAKADNNGDCLHTELWGGGGIKDQALTTGWSRYTFQGTFVSANRTLYFWGVSGNKGNVQIALPQLEIGTVVTDWKPAIEDLMSHS